MIQSPNELEDHQYKPDLEVSDRYVHYSAEILRISLLGIGGFGTLLLLQFDKNKTFQIVEFSKPFLLASVTCWAVSAVLSLAHRYYASDFLSSHIRYLRMPADDPEKNEEWKERKQLLNTCHRLINVSAIFFALGIVSFAISIFIILFSRV